MSNSEIRAKSSSLIKENQLNRDIWKTIGWVALIEIVISFALGIIGIPIKLIPVIGAILGYIISWMQTLSFKVLSSSTLRHCWLHLSESADTPKNAAFYFLTGGTGVWHAFITDAAVRSNLLSYMLQFIITSIFTVVIPGITAIIGGICLAAGLAAYAASKWYGTVSVLSWILLILGFVLLIVDCFTGVYFNLKYAAVNMLVAMEDEPTAMWKKSNRILSKHLWSYFCLGIPYYLWCLIPIAGPIITLLQLPKIVMSNAIYLSLRIEEWDGEY